MASPDSRSRKDSSKKTAVAVPPVVSVIMGSKSDWETMKAASDMLTEFGVAHECRVISAHRTPEVLTGFATTAEARGIEVIIAGAGGAAHLPGMTAAKTQLPVIGVPISGPMLGGLDSLLSIVQMPSGVPVATMAVGNATNAAIFAARILALDDRELLRRLHERTAEAAATVEATKL